ncbi:hypothetical protein V8J82_18730 [Gymnodinialimonas sp. 2305UL16-5]|uniref:hypothetical protein n=1 Tax=Gymnodinialimonas mytili TaxID=3126503 RepID=UPI00309D3CC6
MTPAEATTLPRVIDTLCLDLIEDSLDCEQIFLLASESDPDVADLVVLGHREARPPSALLLVARGITFNGRMWDDAPSLEQSEDGHLLVQSQQFGAGRYPWFETLTLAEHEGHVRIIEYGFSNYGRLDQSGMSCGVDLITGAYSANAFGFDEPTQTDITLLDEHGHIAPNPVLAEDWDVAVGQMPSPCARALTLITAN